MNEPSPVVFVNMPVVGIARPSIALGILKAQLAAAGINTLVLNAHIDFAEFIGLKEVRFLANSYNSMVGEWIFAQAAFDQSPDETARAIEYISQVKGIGSPERLLDLREKANEFVETTARKIVDMHPKIVGCTSVFQQHVSSIALLKFIKQFAPKTLTMIGGANCESEMGRATADLSPWLDLVVSGEADEAIVPICDTLLAHGDLGLEKLEGQDGLFSRRFENSKPAKLRLVCESLDLVAEPNYDEYFSAWQASSFKAAIEPAILAEGSRGCWWGQRSHCVFCGLNGGGMAYRTKSPEKIISELTNMSEKYGVSRIGMVDNILANEWVKNLLPKITAKHQKFELFFETKTNLTRDVVMTLRSAGVICIQPGIESLSSPVLKLMKKGSTARHGVELLKWCAEMGIEVRWSMLVGFVGESAQWYEELLNWLPAIAHLQPPIAVSEVEYHRFSPYHTRSGEFGLNLQPVEMYSHIYPEEARLDDLAFIFKSANCGDETQTEYVIELKKIVSSWKNSFRFDESTLTIEACEDHWLVFDKRYGRNKCMELSDIEAFCLSPQRPALLSKDLKTSIAKKFGCNNREVDEIIESLIEKELMLLLDGRLIALPLAPQLGYPYDGRYAPYGRVNWDNS